MKKLKILCIIFILFIGINQVYAKTYTEYKVGDVVTLSKGTDITSEWIVIENSDSSSEKLKLLKSSIVTGQESVKYGSYTEYENSKIKSVVDSYGLSLSLGNYLESVRLISLSELKELGCNNNLNCSKTYPWLRLDIKYWTSTLITGWSGVCVVNPNGQIHGDAAYTDGIGLRPVIIVSKEAINGGYRNDPREFKNIDITCAKELKSGNDFECLIKMDKEVQNISFDIKIEGLSILEEFNLENITWNEAINLVDNNGIYEQSNITLTKIIEEKDSDNLLKITGKAKQIKEDSVLKFIFNNIKLYDELGDYQIIDELEKEIKFEKEVIIEEEIIEPEPEEEIENPQTGNSIYEIVLIFIISLSSSYITLLYLDCFEKSKAN